MISFWEGISKVQKRVECFSRSFCEPGYLLRVLRFGRYTFVHMYHFFCYTMLHVFTPKWFLGPLVFSSAVESC